MGVGPGRRQEGPHVCFSDNVWMPGVGQLRATHLTRTCFIPSTTSTRQMCSSSLYG